MLCDERNKVFIIFDKLYSLQSLIFPKHWWGFRNHHQAINHVLLDSDFVLRCYYQQGFVARRGILQVCVSPKSRCLQSPNMMLGIRGELGGGWLQELWSPHSVGSNAGSRGSGVGAGGSKGSWCPWCQCPELSPPGVAPQMFHRTVSFFMSNRWRTLLLCVTDGRETQNNGVNFRFSNPDFLVWAACIARWELTFSPQMLILKHIFHICVFTSHPD